MYRYHQTLDFPNARLVLYCAHYIRGSGCKHSKVDQTSAPVYESRDFLGQRPISSSKMLFNIDYFS